MSEINQQWLVAQTVPPTVTFQCGIPRFQLWQPSQQLLLFTTHPATPPVWLGFQHLPGAICQLPAYTTLNAFEPARSLADLPASKTLSEGSKAFNGNPAGPENGKRQQTSRILIADNSTSDCRPGKNREDRRPRPYKQNPSRNIVTNIGNQLITYLSNHLKSQTRLKLSAPHLSEEDRRSFYEYVGRLKKRTDYYLNADKMHGFWYPAELQEYDQHHQRLLRVLSYHFLADLLPICVLTSTKMKKQTKQHHLRIRKELLRLLRKNSGKAPSGEPVR